MYSWLGDSAFFLEDHGMLYNSHDWGVDPKNFETDKGLSEIFELTGVHHYNGVEFTASMESTKYPFFGT